jgi:hypothetical protein
MGRGSECSSATWINARRTSGSGPRPTAQGRDRGLSADSPVNDYPVNEPRPRPPKGTGVQLGRSRQPSPCRAAANLRLAASSEPRVALLRVDSCVLAILGFRSPTRANVSGRGTSSWRRCPPPSSSLILDRTRSSPWRLIPTTRAIRDCSAWVASSSSFATAFR